MRIKETKVYHFNELSDDAKETAIQELSDINVGYEWWQYNFDDAENIGLKITEFELGRNSHCHGDFIGYANDTGTTQRLQVGIVIGFSVKRPKKRRLKLIAVNTN